MGAIISYQEQILNIQESWRQDVNLTPFQSHVNKNKLTKMLMHKFVDVFVCQVRWIYLLKFISCQVQHAKVS